MASHDIPTFLGLYELADEFEWRARVDAEIYRQTAIHPTGMGLWRSS